MRFSLGGLCCSRLSLYVNPFFWGVRTAQWNFSLKDYTVRVRALDIISRLRTEDPKHCEIALAVLDELFERHLGKVYLAKFMNSGTHRKQVLYKSFPLSLLLYPRISPPHHPSKTRSVSGPQYTSSCPSSPHTNLATTPPYSCVPSNSKCRFRRGIILIGH